MRTPTQALCLLLLMSSPALAIDQTPTDWPRNAREKARMPECNARAANKSGHERKQTVGRCLQEGGPADKKGRKDAPAGKR